jgi:3-methyladenine DNA glycosylase AlkD
MTLQQTIQTLRSLGDPAIVEGMKRFGIDSPNAFGITAPVMRALAKEIKKNHTLALKLWDTGYHEAKILAALIADPSKADLKQMDRWANSLENWAQCDAACAEYFQKTRFALALPLRWSKSKKEFVRRAGIVMIAVIAVHHKKLDDSVLEQYFPILYHYTTDERNFVRKAVNWSLRQTGKRNTVLHKKAIALAKEIQNIPSKSAQWIAADALAELNNPKIIARIQRRKVSL